MIYLLSKLFIEKGIPMMKEIFDIVGVSLVVVIGLIFIIGAIAGVKNSARSTSTIINGILRGIGYVFKQIFIAIGKFIKWIITSVPKIFKKSRDTFSSWGINAILSNILATIVVILFLIIII